MNEDILFQMACTIAEEDRKLNDARREFWRAQQLHREAEDYFVRELVKQGYESYLKLDRKRLSMIRRTHK